MQLSLLYFIYPIRLSYTFPTRTGATYAFFGKNDERLDVGQDSKRSQNVPKTGVEIP